MRVKNSLICKTLVIPCFDLPLIEISFHQCKNICCVINYTMYVIRESKFFVIMDMLKKNLVLLRHSEISQELHNCYRYFKLSANTNNEYSVHYIMLVQCSLNATDVKSQNEILILDKERRYVLKSQILYAICKMSIDFYSFLCLCQSFLALSRF